MQCLTGDLFKDFPTLRFLIPHGGGAVPYHWGRFRGLAQELKKPLLDDHLLNNIFFDTCVYHQPGIDLLTKVIPVEEHPVRQRDDRRGARHRSRDRPLLRRHQALHRGVDAADLSADERQIYEGNARRVFPRLDAALKKRKDGNRWDPPCTNSASSSATSCAPTRGGRDSSAAFGTRHRARGDGPRRPDEALHAADLRRRAGLAARR